MRKVLRAPAKEWECRSVSRLSEFPYHLVPLDWEGTRVEGAPILIFRPRVGFTRPMPRIPGFHNFVSRLQPNLLKSSDGQYHRLLTMSLLRPGLPRIGRSIRQFQRSLHYVPGLPHDFKDGIPEFLSPAAFDIAWTQYQGLMVQKLNMLTAGMFNPRIPIVFTYTSQLVSHTYLAISLAIQSATLPPEHLLTNF